MHEAPRERPGVPWCAAADTSASSFGFDFACFSSVLLILAGFWYVR